MSKVDTKLRVNNQEVVQEVPNVLKTSRNAPSQIVKPS
jgi:hypothetical protein